MNIFPTQRPQLKYNMLNAEVPFGLHEKSYLHLPEAPICDIDTLSISEFSDAESIASDGTYRPRYFRPWEYLTAGVCLTLLNLSLLLGSGYCYYKTYHRIPFLGYATTLNEDLKQYSYFSPLLDKISLPLLTKQVNGTLFPGRDPSIYRLPPSPEVDEAWDSISHVAMFPITTSDVVRLGKDPAKAVRLPESLGFPPDTHLAQLDSVHQIHCLNALRKAAFPSYYLGKKQTNRLHWIHLSHCVGILLESLMCQANLDVYTLNWVETQHSPFPDFSVNKQCRDYHVIHEWQQRNRIDEDLLKKIKRSVVGQYVELPAPIDNIMGAFEDAKTPWDFDWKNM